ncbi:hypothetical protein KUTeg_017840 [Tegillarca granosa]|uniref:Splicing factor Cactin C-terminal domain-containing protein n=1 Tax=Tegillarca granosa TaxID=220873 RepID=A0ABQ9EKZ1_TEGGR|nr:hypothetical protein KUTeg_017840 [Tegillarca granosa]
MELKKAINFTEHPEYSNITSLKPKMNKGKSKTHELTQVNDKPEGKMQKTQKQIVTKQHLVTKARARNMKHKTTKTRAKEHETTQVNDKPENKMRKHKNILKQVTLKIESEIKTQNWTYIKIYSKHKALRQVALNMIKNKISVLTPIEDNKDFAILRFKAGPPYEDIAFKIVNREWEYSYKHGFRFILFWIK